MAAAGLRRGVGLPPLVRGAAGWLQQVYGVQRVENSHRVVAAAVVAIVTLNVVIGSYVLYAARVGKR